ncbi:hypothetical protein PHMEG_00028048 [Phytophthora megakarya]|uniref:Uncharacterized protein n=1 Tax=Phytophthora megakarya TaxID=4795 RepID=A0A225V6G9_9STRA|nr:hypothetical protein PHMEG_00028048 [Phytophthora megakarya]
MFLDPYFLHFTRREETSVCYPGLGCDTQPTNLFQVLRDVDAAETSRNQYRAQIQDHPGSQLPRLPGKFVPLGDL